ncbi:MAG: imidazolonepropionase, partial [bacterium]|nr:imidazolonepropionase [bacterium]
MQQRVLIDAKVLPINDNLVGPSLIERGAVAIDGSRIGWVGPVDDLPDDFSEWPTESMCGRLITPALIDCHTHLVYGGNRAYEFEKRLEGASYEQIANAGGGIVSTVLETRRSTEDDLLRSANARLNAFIREGVGTIEIKSGYGLTLEDELKMLRVARQLGVRPDINVVTTFLGAHTIPAEYTGHPDDYIDEVCIPTLRQAAAEGLVDAVDGFCESIAFDCAQISRVFAVAAELELPVKLHAGQLSDIGAVELAASFKALSVEHLEYVTEAGVSTMVANGTVAVLLPSAFYTLRETKVPPVEMFRAAGIPIAVASDCNPGSSPITSLFLAVNMACTLFNLKPMEAIAGVTRNAAKALGL